MGWLYLLLYVVLLVCAAVVGWAVGRRGGRGFGLCLLGAAGLMLLRTFLYAHPEYEQHLLLFWDDYVYFADWGAPLGVLMAFGLAARLNDRPIRRAIVIALALVAPVFCWDTAAVCLRPTYAMPARFDENGVCLQSTSHSCGPAAALMVVRALGEDVSEGEMANLCLLRPGKGVTALELCRGLNIALRATGRRGRIERLAAGELDGQRLPFLAELRRPDGRYHCVSVLDITDDVLTVGDPAFGQTTLDREQFLHRWTGIAITVGGSEARLAAAGASH
ncbi:MAG: cysteine peptidase family C39 domain-containing protein [Planctomycetota bacterium]